MTDVFVVEGKNDMLKLRQVIPKAQVILTNGFALCDVTIDEIKMLSKTNRIVLLLDPDGPGENIRRRINDSVENCYNIFVKKEYAISKNKRKVGIEHLTVEQLKSVLKDCKPSVNKTDITMIDLYKFGLNGKKTSAEKRKKVCDHFNIGYGNSKTLLYKFNLFGITKNEVWKVIVNE